MSSFGLIKTTYLLRESETLQFRRNKAQLLKENRDLILWNEKKKKDELIKQIKGISFSSNFIVSDLICLMRISLRGRASVLMLVKADANRSNLHPKLYIEDIN